MRKMLAMLLALMLALMLATPALAEAIRRICSDDSLHQVLAQGARNRYLKSFTIERMIEKTIKVYNDESLS